jgi:hypothetical protein|uniref:Chitin-binding type-4 domain-containing protein n=1 Tax=Globisporangium ultimum (strain ATCC 200006 / CBS 805.95 / DAOM BR144) TaxID=431595 RepID=K3WN74_GLOUD
MNVFATTGALLLAATPAVLAHGNIVDPPAVWQAGYPQNGFISEVSSTLWGDMDGATYGYGPEGAVKYFTKNFPAGSTLKDLILKNQKMYDASTDPQCGLTIKDEAKRATMPSEVKFSGFSHPGPCELWCDNNKLAFANDCAATYPTGVVPVDASKCAGADRFRIFWIGVHSAPWQVYTDCVYLKGGKSGATTPATTPKAAGSTPTVTSAAPVANDADDETDAPAATPAPAADDDEYATPAPAADDDEYATDAPAASTPSPTKKKCTGKVRRA